VDKVTEEWRKLHSEELSDLYYSPNIVRVIKSRRIRWVGHVARTGREKLYTGFWWENLKKRDDLEDPGARIILRWIFRKWFGRRGLNCSCSGYGQVASTCESGNEPSGSIKCGEFLD
jgi:hypothetical protein